MLSARNRETYWKSGREQDGMAARINLKDRRFLSIWAKQQLTRSIHSRVRREKAVSVGILDSDTVDSRQNGNKHANPDPAFARIDASFENASEAYKSKTNFELIRALSVFSTCSITPLVEHNKEIMKFARKVMGKRLFEYVMKKTFYGQFVAGEDEIRIRPLVERNRAFGVKSILDYSVEKDISRKQAQESELKACGPETTAVDDQMGPNVQFQAHADFGDRRESVTGARTYFYEDEAACDENMEQLLRCIDGVSGATSATGFAAIKLTALGRPQLLLQLSEVLARLRGFYDMLACGNWNEGTIRTADFERHLKSCMLDKDECKRWVTLLDTQQDGTIDLLDWHNLLEVNMSLAKVLRVPNLKTGRLEPLTVLSEEQEHDMKMMLHRIDRVARYGQGQDVRIMIDAEQTYFQTAINRLCMEMMRTYNKEKAIIFNTYQCYLKDAFDTITTDMALSEREGFYFGAKLVRGAYLEQERKRAVSLGYEDPINPNYEATTAMYEKVLEECLLQIRRREKGHLAVMVASHNEDTVKFTLNKMNEYGIHSTDKVICFGQLLGMCDQVSFSLGQAGYSVYKYVPYGPVEEVLPYLSRRALENRGILQKVKKEKRLLRTELFRRLRNFDFFYKPPIPAVAQTTAPASPPPGSAV